MRTRADVVVAADASRSEEAQRTRTCRDCGRRIPAVEARAGLDRLARRFPGVSRQHAYCTGCVRALEVLLGAVGGVAASAREAR